MCEKLAIRKIHLTNCSVLGKNVPNLSKLFFKVRQNLRPKALALTDILFVSLSCAYRLVFWVSLVVSKLLSLKYHNPPSSLAPNDSTRDITKDINPEPSSISHPKHKSGMHQRLFLHFSLSLQFLLKFCLFLFKILFCTSKEQKQVLHTFKIEVRHKELDLV